MNQRASGVGQKRSCLLGSELVNQDDAWSSSVWFKRMYTVVSPHVCLRVCLYECTQTCVYACTCVCIRACVLAKAVLYCEVALRMGGVGHAASVTLRGSRKAQALRMGGGARKLRFWRYVISGRPLTFSSLFPVLCNSVFQLHCSDSSNFCGGCRLFAWYTTHGGCLRSRSGSVIANVYVIFQKNS